jgi:hypothetical protein
MDLTYTTRCDILEDLFCRMVEEESIGGDWDWDMLEQFGRVRDYTEKEIYLVASNLGCHDIPKNILITYNNDIRRLYLIGDQEF